MRYKALVTSKLDNLTNTLSTLQHKVYQGSSAQEMDQWFTHVKEKIEEIQTLINSENEQAQGSW